MEKPQRRDFVLPIRGQTCSNGTSALPPILPRPTHLNHLTFFRKGPLMRGLKLVEPSASVYDARTGRTDTAERFIFVFNMSSTDTEHPTRAKLRKIVQDEFAGKIRGEIKIAVDDLK